MVDLPILNGSYKPIYNWGGTTLFQWPLNGNSDDDGWWRCSPKCSVKTISQSFCVGGKRTRGQEDQTHDSSNRHPWRGTSSHPERLFSGGLEWQQRGELWSDTEFRGRAPKGRARRRKEVLLAKGLKHRCHMGVYMEKSHKNRWLGGTPVLGNHHMGKQTCESCVFCHVLSLLFERSLTKFEAYETLAARGNIRKPGGVDFRHLFPCLWWRQDIPQFGCLLSARNFAWQWEKRSYSWYEVSWSCHMIVCVSQFTYLCDLWSLV